MEIKIKTKMRRHLASFRRAIIKKTKITHWQWWGGGGMPTYCWQECRLSPPLHKTVLRFLKRIKNRAVRWSSKPAAVYTAKWDKILLKRHQPSSADYSTTDDNQDRESAWAPISEQTGFQSGRKTWWNSFF